MADCVLRKCCGIAPEGKLEDGIAYIVCPKCGRRTKSLSLSRDSGGYYFADFEMVKEEVDNWNKEGTDGR